MFRSPSRSLRFREKHFDLSSFCVVVVLLCCFRGRASGMHVAASLLHVREGQQDVRHEQHGAQVGRETGSSISWKFTLGLAAHTNATS